VIGDPAVLYARPARARCREICDEIVHEIQTSPATPVQTGELKAGYHTVDDGPGAAIVTPVDYWHYVEFGTSERAAEPHVRPAIEIVRKRHRR
jgi:HK97 gp10 family phage protein